MGFLSRFEGRMEDTFEGAADKMFDAPISPVQIAKKAEKQMLRAHIVAAELAGALLGDLERALRALRKFAAEIIHLCFHLCFPECLLACPRFQ